MWNGKMNLSEIKFCPSFHFTLLRFISLDQCIHTVINRNKINIFEQAEESERDKTITNSIAFVQHKLG